MYENLLPNVVDGDYSKFDKGISGTLIVDLLSAMVRPFPDWRRNACSMVVGSIANSVHCFYGALYKWVNCNPSGNPLTTLINILVNSFNLRFAYVVSGGPAVGLFDENVRMYLYGDDFILSVSDAAKSVYNFESIQSVFDSVGIKITNPSGKGMVERKFDMTPGFLKRTFRFDRELNHVLAPLDPNSILKMLEWCKRPNLSDTAVLNQVCYQALIETAMHGQDQFDSMQNFLSTLTNDSRVLFAERSLLVLDPPTPTWWVADVLPAGHLSANVPDTFLYGHSDDYLEG
jgi:hypothetical protein